MRKTESALVTVDDLPERRRAQHDRAMATVDDLAHDRPVSVPDLDHACLVLRDGLETYIAAERARIKLAALQAGLPTLKADDVRLLDVAKTVDTAYRILETDSATEREKMLAVAMEKPRAAWSASKRASHAVKLRLEEIATVTADLARLTGAVQATVKPVSPAISDSDGVSHSLLAAGGAGQ